MSAMSGEHLPQSIMFNSSMPAGGEQKARAFYGELWNAELLSHRNSPNARMLVFKGGVQLHLGVESDFRSSRKGASGLTML